MARKLSDYLSWCAEKYTSLKPRSLFQTRKYVTRKAVEWSRKHDPDTDHAELGIAVEECLEAFVHNGTLDDEKYARWYISEKQYFKPRGIARIRYDLVSKGVSEDIIDAALQKAEFTDAYLLEQTLRTRFASVDLTQREMREKVTRRLLQKGFRFSDVQVAIQRAIEE